MKRDTPAKRRKHAPRGRVRVYRRYARVFLFGPPFGFGHKKWRIRGGRISFKSEFYMQRDDHRLRRAHEREVRIWPHIYGETRSGVEVVNDDSAA